MARSLLSSPPRMPSSQARERRKASITPRKFQRFFTPRSRVSSQPTSASSRALRDLTASALNRCQTPSSPLKAISEERVWDDAANAGGVRATKRRKMQHTPETSPLRPRSPHVSSPPSAGMPASPSRRRQLLSPIRSLPASQDVTDTEDMMSEDDLPSISAPVTRTVPLPSRGLAAQLAQRMTGGVPRGGHQLLRCPVADWRAETADFCSTPEDVHMCPSNEGPGQCIPFSVASCNTNSLVAVGDEEGYIRLLDSNKEFGKIHLSFQAHSNAIIDMAFSEDDYLLATASGDQTGKVIDMLTQTPISILANHTASLKQVRFQPGRGSSSVLATSSRDGSIQIWDLRCRNGAAPVQEILDHRPTSLGYRAPPRKINSGCVVNSIYGAHAHPPQHRYQTRHNPNLHLTSLPSSAATSSDIGSRGEAPGRIGEVSVTAIQFLHPGQEHLLLSASEADATVKLWDIRSIQTTGTRSHRTYPTPVSHTRQPESHLSFRPFGISALALSAEPGGRLYTLSKDNTIYAYSVAHLVLGHAPELSRHAGSEPPRRVAKGQPPTEGGLGPLYGFRHPSFHATSFYVKAAVRPARDGRPEMLAVGSSDGCPVVFPTDERYFRRDLGAGRGAPPNGVDERSAPVINLSGSFDGGAGAAGARGQQRRPGVLARTNSVSNISARLNDSVPVYKPYGTALVRGHDKEVGPLAWTRDGKLVTVGDDYAVRCWGEDRERAADLRGGGEVNGRRWACGWADVGEGWEGDEDDW
ncbi:WD40 repeat-like protein [Coniochaeta ligniaria NRRL 30616]|uniref:WD40 repeat-like protein n=1 Tax=Coniochaeta ligniaria NRRL 30616 TaxID=1408157 RepID=A0A1J7JJ32_9PEZI|nr:WD40 repeat-like protein [Coniochaeta ligniaria NRRL 30616]